MTVAEEQEIQQSIRELKSPLAKYRNYADLALKRRLPEALPLLMEAEKREATKRRVSIPLTTGALIFYALFMLVFFTFRLIWKGDWSWMALFATIIVINSVQSARQMKGWASQFHLTLLSLLSESEDIRALPTLLKNLNIRGNKASNEVHEQILANLPLLLAKATPQDLPPHCLPGLHLLLKEGNTTQRMAALLALEQVGNASSLPHILAVIRRVRLPATSSKNQLLQFAGYCREVIEARIAEQNVSGTLLRPSEVPPLPETLLRPIDSALPETDPQELLRAGVSHEETETQTISHKGN